MRDRPAEAHVRRRVSALLITVGALVLVGSGASVARGALARDAARTRWAELEAQHAATGARAMMAGGTGWAAAPGAPVARLLIPRLGLDEVVVEGIGDDALRAGPGHMTGSALPGEPGNSVISAHRDRHFRPLGGLVVACRGGLPGIPVADDYDSLHALRFEHPLDGLGTMGSHW